MKVTVILCTYNRCQELARALASLAQSSMPESLPWEVLIVDNNSNDQTREVTENYCRTCPDHFRYQFEPRQGKSNALNTGLREARGEVIAFVDDDVTVDPIWLKNLTAPLLHGPWMGAGGPVLPQQDFVIPDWIDLNDRYAFGPLVMFDLGPSQADLTEAPFGTNMAFKRSMFEQYGGFRTDLGPQPGSEIRGEDSEFFYRLRIAGEPMCYEPSALVYHSIPPQRLTKAYFLAWWFDKGRADVRALGTIDEPDSLTHGAPIIWIRRFIMWAIRWLFAPLPPRRFSARLNMWFLAGQLTEFYRIRYQGTRATRREHKSQENTRRGGVITTIENDAPRALP